uniref:Uncharacterized protein n=1 Tax=viral metagenome TaxID=1070528 RepID=A0A6C0E366_9ZZZZ
MSDTAADDINNMNAMDAMDAMNDDNDDNVFSRMTSKRSNNEINNSDDDDDDGDNNNNNNNNKNQRKNNEIELNKLLDYVNKNCIGNTKLTQKHLFDITDDNDLLNFAKINNYLEILDSSHDLQRNSEQTNPLYKYYYDNLEGLIYINGKILMNDDTDVTNLNNIDNCKTQNAVKSKMKEIIQNSNINKALGRLKYTDSTIKTIMKTLPDLQIFLKKEEMINITLIETHRGGDPNNAKIKNNIDFSSMYKSEISTIFDLNTSLGPDFMLNVYKIYDNDNNDSFENYLNLKKTEFGRRQLPNYRFTFPLLRFYSNYFPNAFSAFIGHNELFNMKLLNKELLNDETNDIDEFIFNETITKILNTYNNALKNVNRGKGENDITIYTNEIKKSIKQNFDFFTINPKKIYLLHMFSDIDGKWTFSIQKGPVTADMVTMELYGIKKRNFSSVISSAFCNTKVKDFTNSLILLSNRMTKITKDTHVSNGKLIGDGAAKETALLISFFQKIPIALLSSDICCCFRALHSTGFAVRQLPTKLAGTGFGGTEQNRKIEIYKNIEITDFTQDKYSEIIINFYNKRKHMDDENIVLKPFNFNTTTNAYLSDILLPDVTKYFKHNIINNINTYIDKYDIELVKLVKLADADKSNICELIKEIYSCPYIKKDASELCEEAIEDYMNELQNLINIIENDIVKTGIPNRIFLDTHIEKLIKIVASIEIKLQTIYTDNDTIKQHVVFNLLLLFKINKIGSRPLTNYINKIVDYIAKIPEIKTEIENMGIIINLYPIVTKYQTLYDIFIEKYSSVRQQDEEEYEKKQLVKQPLNILKYLCRADYLYNLFTTNRQYNIGYTSVFFNSFKIVYMNDAKIQFRSLPSSPNQYDDDNIVDVGDTILKETNDDDDDDDDDESVNQQNAVKNLLVDGEIKDNLSNSLNPATNFVEHQFDMDEKEAILFEQTKTEINLNIVINRIDDEPSPKISIFETLTEGTNQLLNYVFKSTSSKRGGSSFIKRKEKKSQKHKKNKKYTIRKDLNFY